MRRPTPWPCRGLYSAEQRRVRQQQALALDGGVSELASQIALLESQRTDLALQLARLPEEVAQTRAGILEAIEALEEKRAGANAQNGFSLVARAAGTVTSLQDQVGQPVDPTWPTRASSCALPPGYRPARLPRARRIENDAFTYESRWSLEEGVLRVSRRLVSRVGQPLCEGPLRAATAKALGEIRRDYDARIELEKEG